jgi:hypothetical protein
MTTPGVDFFRVDRSATTRRLLVSGVCLVTGGATAIGAHLVRRLPESMSHLVSLVGGLAVIAGLVTSFGTLAMMLFENVYMTIRDDGLLVHDNGKETVIAWEELADVVVDAPKGLVELRRPEKEVLRWHAGKAARDVAGRIEEAKRKAAHGLLHTPS